MRLGGGYGMCRHGKGLHGILEAGAPLVCAHKGVGEVTGQGVSRGEVCAERCLFSVEPGRRG